MEGKAARIERVRRGQIFRVNFDDDVPGSTMRKEGRPALVIQNNAGNTHSPETIIVAIRHDTRKGLPIHVSIPPGVGGVKKDSVVDCGKIYTLLQEDLAEFMGQLPADYMEKVDEALRISLAL